jgi:hypothetical protein
MKTVLRIVICFMMLLASLDCHADCIKKIVFMRHGEKDEPVSYGQLNCQGQNRALALPAVLAGKFGKPAAIYACNPSITSDGGCDDAGSCCTHSRPYATINPTAVANAMQVLASYASGNVGGPESPDFKAVTCNGVPPATPMLELPQQHSSRANKVNAEWGVQMVMLTLHEKFYAPTIIAAKRFLLHGNIRMLI